jgi:hypothetical protein
MITGVAQLVEAEQQNPWDRLTRKAALAISLFAAPIYVLFACFGEPARGRAAAICAFIFLGILWLRWDLRGRAWFWVTYGALLVFHIPVVYLIRWSNTNYPGVVLLPLGLVDFAIVYSPIRLLERVQSRQSQSR